MVPAVAMPIYGVSKPTAEKVLNQTSKQSTLTIALSDPALIDDPNPDKRYLEFTVTLYVQGYRVCSLRGIVLRKGRIQTPSRPMKVTAGGPQRYGGMLWARLLEPSTPFLLGIEKAIKASGWLEGDYAEFGPLAPIREWPSRPENLDGVRAKAVVKFD